MQGDWGFHYKVYAWTVTSENENKTPYYTDKPGKMYHVWSTAPYIK